MADQLTLRLNIAAIMRVDPYAKDIDDQLGHVAVYTFNLEEQIWEQTDADSAIFIYSRNAEPYRSVFICNKLNNKTLVEPITARTECKIEPPYLFFRNELSCGRCFCFRNDSECNRIGTLVKTIIQNSDESSMHDSAQHSRQMSKNEDIFSMLTKAQEDFNKSTVCIPAHINKARPEMFSDNRRSSSDMTSQSVIKFFATSKKIPVFRKLSSQPMDVNQIEKQQRIPHENNKSAPQTLIDITKSLVGPEEKRLGAAFKRTRSSNHPSEFSTSHVNINTKILPTSNPLSDSSIQWKPTPNGVQLKPKPIQRLLRTFSGSAPSQGPPLMSPVMFSATEHSTDKYGRMTTIPEVSSTNVNQQETSQSVQTEEHNTPEPLTQGQLLQAMNYLMRNDPNFVVKLHEAYLNFFTETLSL